MFEVVIFVLCGALLIFLETLLVGGIWCIMGLGLCSWAVWLAYVQYGVVGAVLCGGFSILACAGAFLFWLYVLPKTRLGKSIYLSSKQDGRASKDDFRALIGKTGVAESMLVPSGKVKIDGVLFDARSQFQSIEAGSKIEVVQADSFSVVVKKI